MVSFRKVLGVFRIIVIIFISVILFFATGLVNKHFEPEMEKTCSMFNSTTHLNECVKQRRAMFLFIVFCVVRIVSYKFEYLCTKSSNECLMRKTLPGRHLGGALGIPFLTRTLYLSIQLQAVTVFTVALFLSTSIAFYPYCKDLVYLCKYVTYGIQRRLYKADPELIITLSGLYIYFSILIIEILDVSVGIYCHQRIFGVSLLFPNINFPLLLYFIHAFVIRYHKKMPLIIYEVNDEDCFVQLHRLRCLSLKDCPHMSSAVRLSQIPSLTTTIQRREFDGRIVQVRDLRELESIIPCPVTKQHKPEV